MKFQILLLGVALCLGAPAQTKSTSQNAKTTQSANRMKRQPVSKDQSLTGCVDQQNGRYVIRDAQTSQILNLQSPGSDDDTWFARYVGHKAEVSGSSSSGTLRVSHIQQVADMCGTGQ
jgi:hypothetical protein